MALLGHSQEFGSKLRHTVEALPRIASTTRELGQSTLRLLAWGPKVTDEMLYGQPEPKPDIKSSIINGLSPDEVESDPSIILSSKAGEELYHIDGTAPGDGHSTKKWHYPTRLKS